MLRRKLARAAGGLVLLVAAILAGTAAYLRSALPDLDADAALPGLSAPVEVWRDELGIPSIRAANERDLFRAVGYVHAQDRLWQMELLRRVAEGRLAEVLGPGLVNTDRFLRTLDLVRAADRDLERLTPEERELFQAYAEGVNAWIAHHPGALPPELVALRCKPGPWSARSSLGIGKVMAWDLSAWDLELRLQQLADRLPPELLQALMPRYPEWGVDTLAPADGGVAAPPPAGPGQQGLLRPPGRLRWPAFPAEALDLLARASIARASNAWVLDGTRTRSGKPLLANDVHLALQAPPQWYLAAIHGGGIEVAGMMLPGVPMVIAGHSRQVAWGFTASMVDDVDFFWEQVDPKDPSRYLAPEGPLPFEVRVERIEVAGGEPVLHQVRATRHGPVLSDVEPRAGDRVLAMSWTAHQGGRDAAAFLKMNRARSVAELRAAAREASAPSLNLLMADASGAVAFQVAGRVPVRKQGEGVLPGPGWTGEHDWSRALEPEELPFAVNPPSGLIVSANNRQVGPGYPFLLTRKWAEPFRAARLQELLEPVRDGTADQAARMQMDVRDALAVRYLPLARRAARESGLADASAALEAWTGEARADSRAAAIFYLWYHGMRSQLAGDELKGEAELFPYYAQNRILDSGGGKWVDDVRTPEVETLEALAARSMKLAVEQAGGRSWGDLHRTRIPHALGSNALLDFLLRLNVGPFSSDGAITTVNVSEYERSAPPFVAEAGPSQRHVVDLGDPDGAGGFVIPTGQSGIPFSPHYRDQTTLWRSGRLVPIPLDPERARARAKHRATLRP